MSKLEKLIRKYLPKTTDSIEKNVLDVYFYKITNDMWLKNKSKTINQYQGDTGDYVIEVRKV